jgi:hypothetical protein
MDKFITWTVTLTLAFFLLTAAFGIQYNRHFKTANMPPEILYEVHVEENIWPDRFYASSYSDLQPRGFHLTDYWTFEPGKSPFSDPLWVYHPYELTMTDVNFVVNAITR